jgi:hypothetical protein
MIQLVVAEEIQEGHVSWKAVNLMLSNLSAYPILFWAVYLLGCSADEAAEVFQMCT